MLKVKVISLPYIFQVLYVLCLAKISGERLQDHWSSGCSLEWPQQNDFFISIQNIGLYRELFKQSSSNMHLTHSTM